ncbi:MAG: YHS domain-containing (seleno)protein [Sphingomonadales bacterium]|jgi:YHS domain-containing protein
MKKIIIAVLVVAAAVAAYVFYPTAKSEIYTASASAPAVSGYDTVAYFTQGEPAEGKSEFSTEWKGATWLFASADHLAKFKANPEAYAPQFGGYCAWAVSHGYTASADPQAWRIIDDKLYLNYNKPTQAEWLKDTATYIVDGNENWPSVLAE